MKDRLHFEALYKTYVEDAMLPLQSAIGEPVILMAEDFDALLDSLRSFSGNYPNMAFWMVINLRHSAIQEIEGLQNALGSEASDLKSFLQLIHPDYMESFFQWAISTYSLMPQFKEMLKPLHLSHRVTVPLKASDGKYYWYSQHATVTQIDRNGLVVTHLNTYYYEGPWSEHNLRPFEACLFAPGNNHTEMAAALHRGLAPYVIDAFTNAELELLTHYARKTPKADLLVKMNWTGNTLNEYNKRILQKARSIFHFKFRTAKDFAHYCFDKGFLYVSPT